MYKTPTINYIIKSIQHGEFSAYDQFYSIKELSIKFKISETVAKHSIQYAIKTGLLLSKGRGRKAIVNDISKYFYEKEFLKPVYYNDPFSYSELKKNDKNVSLLKKEFFEINKTLSKKTMHWNAEGGVIASTSYIYSKNEILRDSLSKGNYITTALRASDLVISKIITFLDIHQHDDEVIVKRIYLQGDEVVMYFISVVNIDYFKNSWTFNFY